MAVLPIQQASVVTRRRSRNVQIEEDEIQMLGHYVLIHRFMLEIISNLEQLHKITNHTKKMQQHQHGNDEPTSSDHKIAEIIHVAEVDVMLRKIDDCYSNCTTILLNFGHVMNKIVLDDEDEGNTRTQSSIQNPPVE